MNVFVNNNLLKFSVFSLIPFSLTALLGAVFFLPLQQPSSLIASFDANMIAISLGLAGGLMLLHPASWRPLYFPMIALLPVALALLLTIQIGLNLVAYWQQQLLVVLYLLWSAFVVVLGAQLRREFSLPAIVFALSMTIVTVSLVYAIATILHQLAPQIFAAVPVADVAKPDALLSTIASQILVLTSFVYLYVSRRINAIAAVLIALVLLTSANLSGQAQVVVQALAWPDMGYYLGLIKTAWVVFLSQPLLGAGWGQFAWQDFQLAQTIFTQTDVIQPVAAQTGLITHPHNLLMQLLAETGLLGFGLVVISIGLWFIGLRRDTAQDNAYDKPSHQVRAAHWWLAISLITLAIIAIFQDGFAHAPVLGMVALMLGVLEARIKKLYLSAGPILVGALGLVAAVQLVQLNQQYNTLQHWYSQTQFTQFNKAQIGPMFNILGPLKHQSLLTPYIDTAIVRALPNNPELVQDKLVLNTQLMQHSPKAQEVYIQAQLLAQNGQVEKAKQQMQHAIAKHPDDLDDFSQVLLKVKSAQTLPLLRLIIKHNVQTIELEKNTKAKGKTTH